MHIYGDMKSRVIDKFAFVPPPDEYRETRPHSEHHKFLAAPPSPSVRAPPSGPPVPPLHHIFAVVPLQETALPLTTPHE